MRWLIIYLLLYKNNLLVTIVGHPWDCLQGCWATHDSILNPGNFQVGSHQHHLVINVAGSICVQLYCAFYAMYLCESMNKHVQKMGSMAASQTGDRYKGFVMVDILFFSPALSTWKTIRMRTQKRQQQKCSSQTRVSIGSETQSNFQNQRWSHVKWMRSWPSSGKILEVSEKSSKLIWLTDNHKGGGEI